MALAWKQVEKLAKIGKPITRSIKIRSHLDNSTKYYLNLKLDVL